MTQVLNFSNKVKILPIFPFTILAIKKKKQSSRIYEPEKIRIYFSWFFFIPTFTSIRGILPCWSPREIIVEVLALLTVTSLGVVCTNTLTMNLK